MISASRTLNFADYQARGLRGVFIGQQPMWWPPKQAGDFVDYSIDLSESLAADGERPLLATAQVAPSSSGDVRVADLTLASGVITAWLTHGVPGRFYTIQMQVKTDARRTINLNAFVEVAPPFIEGGAPPVPAGPPNLALDGVVDASGVQVAGTDGNPLFAAPTTWTSKMLVSASGQTVTTTGGLPILSA